MDPAADGSTKSDCLIDRVSKIESKRRVKTSAAILTSWPSRTLWEMMIFLDLRRANILGSCMLILICGGLGTQIMGIKSGVMVDPLGPRFFPGVILAMVAALSILVIGISIKNREEVDTVFATRSGLTHTVLTLVIFVAYVVGLGTVGYAIATALFLFVLSAYYYGKVDKQLIAIAIYAVVSTIGVYLLFTHVFSIRLPRGVL